MIDLRVKGDVTKGRLIESTESLIAQKGFDAVSVRDITGLAKANVAAVNYHFGSREGLLAAVLDFRMKPLAKERTERLEALGEQATLRDIFQAWVKPLLSASASKGLNGQAHCRVLGRCLEILSVGTFPEASAASQLLDAAVQKSLGRHLSALPAEAIAWRWHFAKGALIHSLVHGAAAEDHFRLKDVLEQWVDAMLAQFAATDAGDERQVVVEKSNPAPRKSKSTSPLRQMVEVVSAVMEADEEQLTTLVVNEAVAATPVEPETTPTGKVVASAKPAKGKKAKAEEGAGELFLF